MSRRRRRGGARLKLFAVLAVLTWGAWARWVLPWWHATGSRWAADVTPPIIGVLVLAGLVCAAAAVRLQRRARDARLTRAAATGVWRPGNNGSDLDRAVADLLHRQGLRHIRIVGGSGDLGADVTAETHDGRKVVVQDKCYRPDRNLGSPAVQTFGGTAFAVHGADIALLVTTAAGFSRAAQALGPQLGILLVAQPQLGAALTGQAPLIPPHLLRSEPRRPVLELDPAQYTTSGGSA